MRQVVIEAVGLVGEAVPGEHAAGTGLEPVARIPAGGGLSRAGLDRVPGGDDEAFLSIVVEVRVRVPLVAVIGNFVPVADQRRGDGRVQLQCHGAAEGGSPDVVFPQDPQQPPRAGTGTILEGRFQGEVPGG